MTVRVCVCVFVWVCVCVPKLWVAVSMVTPQVAMAELVLTFLFEHNYGYIAQWTAFMLQAISYERQVHNCIWMIAAGPFDIQFALPECACASGWFWCSDAREIPALMAVSQRLAACGYSIGIQPKMLRYVLTPTWMPNPFEWRSFQENLTGTQIDIRRPALPVGV